MHQVVNEDLFVLQSRPSLREWNASPHAVWTENFGPYLSILLCLVRWLGQALSPLHQALPSETWGGAGSPSLMSAHSRRRAGNLSHNLGLENNWGLFVENCMNGLKAIVFFLVWKIFSPSMQFYKWFISLRRQKVPKYIFHSVMDRTQYIFG